MLALTGVALVFGSGVTTAKTVLLAVFVFITNPTAAHAITRAAYDQNIVPWTAEAEAEVNVNVNASANAEGEDR